MIYGIGTDLLKIERIKNVCENKNDPFVVHTYTPEEIRLIESRTIPLYSYATRFCGKEAVFKCLNYSESDFHLSDIEILENENGMPTVTLYGNLKVFADKNKISSLHLSLSYDTEYAIAYALAESY